MHHKAHMRWLLAAALGLSGLCEVRVAPAHGAPASAAEAKQKAKEYFKQGIAYQTAGDYLRAAEELQAAYEFFPSPAMLFNLGQVYRLKGDRKLAIDYYQRYLKEVPSGSASDESREYLQKLTEAQVAEDQEKAKSQLALVPPAPPSQSRDALDLTKAPPPSDTHSNRRRWGFIGGGIGAAVAGGVIAGVLVGTANRDPASDGRVTVP
jgi:tetratricopeptide (TPR) repeat protein